jgi:hypothetical protein
VLVTKVANLATSHIGRALGTSEASVWIEDSARSAAVVVADAVDVESIA